MVIHTRLRLIIQQGFKSDKHKYVSMRKMLSTAAISMSVFISCTTTRVSDIICKHTADPIEVAIADYAITENFFKRKYFFFFFNDTAPTKIYTLSLHDALPISCKRSYG